MSLIQSTPNTQHPHHPPPPTPTTPPTNTRTTTTTNQTPLFADPGGNKKTNIPVSVEIADLGIQQNTFYARKGESNLSFLRHFYMYVAAYSTDWLYALTKWKPRWKQADTCKIFNTFQIFVNLCLKKLPLFSFREFANPNAKILLFSRKWLRTCTIWLGVRMLSSYPTNSPTSLGQCKGLRIWQAN